MALNRKQLLNYALITTVLFTFLLIGLNYWFQNRHSTIMQPPATIQQTKPIPAHMLYKTRIKAPLTIAANSKMKAPVLQEKDSEDPEDSNTPKASPSL